MLNPDPNIIQLLYTLIPDRSINIEYRIKSNKNKPLSIFVNIERNGQEHPTVGNKIQVTVTCILPTIYEDSDHQLDINLQSGIKFMDMILNCEWGVVRSDGGISPTYTREFTKTFTAEKWSEGFKCAETWIDTEIQPVLNQLINRYKAYIDADL
jgi:hypothetical protein